MSKLGFMAACMKYFGRRPGQTLTEFSQEMAKLTPEDRAEFKPLLEKELGIEIE